MSHHSLAGSVVLVTGGTGGLGTATVERFHEAGATVCVSARSEPTDGAVAERLDTSSVSFYPADLTNPDDAKEVVDAVISDHDRLDALIALVGTWNGGSPLHETDIDEIEAVLAINLRSCYLTAKYAIPALRTSNGSLVTVSAQSARQGGSGDGPYRASKAAVRILTESIAAENDDQVTATTILPEIIDTPMNREMMPDADHDDWTDPQDIAEVIQFLCSDAATPISGAAIPVN